MTGLTGSVGIQVPSVRVVATGRRDNGTLSPTGLLVVCVEGVEPILFSFSFNHLLVVLRVRHTIFPSKFNL